MNLEPLKTTFLAETDAQGRITIKNESALKEWARTRPNSTFVIEVSVVNEKEKSRRSHNYYWKGIVPVIAQRMRELGFPFNKEQTHEFLKHQCPITQWHPVDISITDADSYAWSSYIDWAKMFAVTKLEIVIE